MIEQLTHNVTEKEILRLISIFDYWERVAVSMLKQTVQKETKESYLKLYYGFCLFDLILYIASTIFQLNRDGSSWIEPVLG